MNKRRFKLMSLIDIGIAAIKLYLGENTDTRGGLWPSECHWFEAARVGQFFRYGGDILRRYA